MQNHEQFAAELPRYLLGEIEAGERAELDRHLGACGECRAELQKLQGDLALVALSSPVAQPPQSSRVRLLEAIRREPRMKPVAVETAAPRLRLFWWIWSPSIAALALALAVALLWHDNRDLRQEAGQLASIVAQTQLDYQNTKELLTALTDREPI